jgi:7-carboxy-7-deazaguanine synthase
VTYQVKECFHTLQGEGAHAGRAAVFLRFAGCNLWSGREETRETAVCTFCDTDFIGTDGEGGGVFRTPEDLATHVEAAWTVDEEVAGRRYVVCTGGEPLLQVDESLIAALHERGFEVAVETNGTIAAPPSLDWVCVSPKANAALVQTSGNELKLVYPQLLSPPERFVDLDFEHFLLQPMDVGDVAANADLTKQAVEYCRRHPRWRLSLQTHKILDIP